MNRDQILKSYETILEMLQDRGIPIEPREPFTLKDNIKKIIEVPIGEVKVVYYTPPKFKFGDINKDIDIFKDPQFRLFILVVKEPITQSNKNDIHKLKLPIEVHLLSRLQINPTKHEYASPHRVIRDPQEIEAIVQKYKLKNKYQLPILLKDDAMARWYGMQSGEIAEIIRPSESAGEYIFYRCCL